MKAPILLIDLQGDFLDAPALRPVAPAIAERAAGLLEGGRRAGAAIFHIWTTVHHGDDRRWRTADVAGPGCRPVGTREFALRVADRVLRPVRSGAGA